MLTAFFLEAGFLGVMLFGWNRVGPQLHFVATAMVAIGTLISATWILAANSWMQTPQGYAIEGGRMVPVDWLAIVFNPSFPFRLMHMVVAAYLTTALIVGATGAWQLLRRRDNPAVRTMQPIDLGSASSETICFNRLRSDTLEILREIPPPWPELGISTQ